MRSYNRLKDLLLVTLLTVANDGKDIICSSNTECGSNQCCVWDLGWSGDLKRCAPMRPERSECLVSNDQPLKNFGSSFFKDACPCEPGYSCQGDDDTSYKGTCVKPCSNRTDCATDECCESLAAPSNRKKRDLFAGTCQKYGAAHDDCYVLDEKDDDVNFLCPCDIGLYCQGTGDTFDDFPTGEAGRCVPVNTNDKAIPGK